MQSSIARKLAACADFDKAHELVAELEHHKALDLSALQRMHMCHLFDKTSNEYQQAQLARSVMDAHVLRFFQIKRSARARRSNPYTRYVSRTTLAPTKTSEIGL